MSTWFEAGEAVGRHCIGDVAAAVLLCSDGPRRRQFAAGLGHARHLATTEVRYGYCLGEVATEVGEEPTAETYVIELPPVSLLTSTAAVEFRLLQRLIDAPSPVVLLDWGDVRRVSPGSRSDAYLAACVGTDFVALREANRTMRTELVAAGAVLRLRTGEHAVLEVEIEATGFRSEDCEARPGHIREPAFQLPGGEVYAAITPGGACGVVALSTAEGPRSINVRDGMADFRGVLPAQSLGGFGPRCPISEVGFGTNPRAVYAPSFQTSEKARRTAHLGFGHNVDLGGRIDAGYHFDLVFPEYSIEW